MFNVDMFNVLTCYFVFASCSLCFIMYQLCHSLISGIVLRGRFGFYMTFSPSLFISRFFFCCRTTFHCTGVDILSVLIHVSYMLTYFCRLPSYVSSTWAYFISFFLTFSVSWRYLRYFTC